MFSYVLTAFGITCFYLAGKKIWWSWYIGIIGQFVWFAYALITDQWGFIIGSLFYTAIYINNSIKWTKQHFNGDKR